MLSILTLILECGICSLLKSVKPNSISDALALFFIIVFSITFLIELQKSRTLSKYNLSLSVGYLLRLFFLLFDRYGQSIFQLPNSGADTEWFYELAVVQASNLSGKRHGGFIGLFSSIFSVIGTNRLFGQFIVVLFSIVSLCVLALTIDKLNVENESKIRGVFLVSILPNFAILSSVFLRESIVTMFITVSFYCFFRYYHGGATVNLFICYGCVLIGSYYHSGAAGFLIGYTIVILLYQRNTDMNRMGVLRTLSVCVIALILAYLFVQYKDIFFAKMSGIENLSDIANNSQAAGSSYAAYAGDSSSISNMIIYTIPRLVLFLFSPLPWQWRGIADIIAFLFSGLYYLYITIIAFRCIANKKTKNRTLIINVMIVLGCATFVFAWGVSSAGTAARHRDKLVTVFAVIYSLCISPHYLSGIKPQERLEGQRP